MCSLTLSVLSLQIYIHISNHYIRHLKLTHNLKAVSDSALEEFPPEYEYESILLACFYCLGCRWLRIYILLFFFQTPLQCCFPKTMTLTFPLNFCEFPELSSSAKTTLITWNFLVTSVRIKPRKPQYCLCLLEK